MERLIEVLAVDDNEQIVTMYKRLGKFMGANVEGHTDPFTALDAYRIGRERYNLVITDRSFGRNDINGDEFARRVREISEEDPAVSVRIVMATSDELSPEEVQALSLDGYLKKPASIHAYKAEVDATRASLNP